MAISHSELNTIRARNQLLSQVCAAWRAQHIAELHVNLGFAYYFVSTEKRKHVGWHQHRFFEFSYVRSGKIEYRIGRQRLEVPTGGIYFLPNGITHSWIQKASPLVIDSFALHVTPDDAELKQRLAEHAASWDYHLKKAPKVAKAADRLWETTNPLTPLTLAKEYSQHLIAEMVLTLFQMQCAELFPAKSLDSVPRAADSTELAEEIHTFLENNLEANITLQDLSRHFHYSGRHLNRVYSDNYGLTINAAVLDIRLRQAREMLLMKDMPIKAIAYTLGFKDVSYFCRFFKRYCGMQLSPQNYRRKMLRKTPAASKMS